MSFLSALLESNVEIVFCDFPQANKMVLHILASISQYEAELISTRTKQALAEEGRWQRCIRLKSTGEDSARDSK